MLTAVHSGWAQWQGGRLHTPPLPAAAAVPSRTVRTAALLALRSCWPAAPCPRTWLARRPSPMRKLSGLMSRWMKLLLCMYSMRDSCTQARQGDPSTEPRSAA